ncbi:hypothetical protein H0H93_011870 [Arthromyces matolae]|nr:hypothetical protein H0H93_011870 [Arthromyces matolae]
MGNVPESVVPKSLLGEYGTHFKATENAFDYFDKDFKSTATTLGFNDILSAPELKTQQRLFTEDHKFSIRDTWENILLRAAYAVGYTSNLKKRLSPQQKNMVSDMLTHAKEFYTQSEMMCEFLAEKVVPLPSPPKGEVNRPNFMSPKTEKATISLIRQNKAELAELVREGKQDELATKRLKRQTEGLEGMLLHRLQSAGKRQVEKEEGAVGRPSKQSKHAQR